MYKQFNIVILLFLITILTLKTVNAAFCSLRDPISAIQTLYEDGYDFRSLITTISEEDRLMIKRQLPFTIHQGEVGKHTLYVLYKHNTHAGFLQARSEWAKWGIVEIAWAINIDRSIKGFYFQRCRSPLCNDGTTKEINLILQNKSFSQLKALLSEDGKSFSAEGAKLFNKTPSMALLALRSALKTLAITDISWAKDIKKL